jgi:hypothetical protein
MRHAGIAADPQFWEPWERDTADGHSQRLAAAGGTFSSLRSILGGTDPLLQ